MMPANRARPPSSASTAPMAISADPSETPRTSAPTSRRAIVASSRTIVALPSARSRTRAPMPRASFRSPAIVLLLERLADQIAETDGDQQCAPRVLLHLALDARLETVEIGVAQPIGCRFHSTS